MNEEDLRQELSLPGAFSEPEDEAFTPRGAWTEEHRALFSIRADGQRSHSFFFHQILDLAGPEYSGEIELHCHLGLFRLRGPGLERLHLLLQKNEATELRSDGKDLTSITFEPLERR